MSHTVIDGRFTVTDRDGDRFALDVTSLSNRPSYAYLDASRRGTGSGALVYLDMEDLRALAEFCARAVGAEPPLVWRECDPKEIQVGWLVESRNGNVATRGVVARVADDYIWSRLGDGVPELILWSDLLTTDGWSLWTTAPAPEYTPEERALRDLLSDLDPETFAKVVTAAKAAFGGGSK